MNITFQKLLHGLVFVWVGVGSFGLNARADVTPGRTTLDLSGPGWKLWRDKDGAWRKDHLYIHDEATDTYKREDDPEIDDPSKPGKWKLSDISVPGPTGGWDSLDSKVEANVTVPCTLEQYLWGRDGGAADDVKGDYVGVSWWWKTITVPAKAAGKRIAIDFGSVNRRAEIFLDGQLVGYDCIGNTPFSIDITKFAKPGQAQQLAVRITNPGGYLSWTDNPEIIWGSPNWQSGGGQASAATDPKYRDAGITVNSSRGFSGILGAVKIQVTDPVRISDLWMRNTPAITDADATVEVKNNGSQPAHGSVHLDILDKKSGQNVFSADQTDVIFPPDTSQVVVSAHVPQAVIWNLDHPHLYQAHVKLTANDHSFADDADQTFGFRWFEPKNVGTDATYQLNGKRIVLLSAISWGFWPITGIVPSPEMAQKQVAMAKKIGLNMLNFHRAIGQPWVFDQADQQGLLYLEEPGGYEGYWADPFGYANNREKLLRMVRRDRSHPSLIIYNCVNESSYHFGPVDVQKRDMKDAHLIDPTRVETWTSGGNVGDPGKPGEARPWMMPLNQELLKVGHLDQHNTATSDVYLDAEYKNPDWFLKHSVDATKPAFTHGFTDPGEIVFWGEEGAMGTPSRLALIHSYHQTPGVGEGWDGDFEEALYQGYAKSLKDLGLDKYFTVDSLCQTIGEKEFYYHGRIIENIKVNNVTDGYVVNGWENDKNTSLSGLVDLYRNPKTDKTELISYYTQPLYVAVKIRNKIAKVGDTVATDFYVVNEVNMKGPATLEVALVSPSGHVSSKQSFAVDVTGGEVYGQLLQANVQFPLGQETGAYTVRARLNQDNGKHTKGSDEAFVVDWKSAPLPQKGAIVESTGEVAKFLGNQKGLSLSAWNPDSTNVNYVVVGEDTSPDIAATRSKILDAVQNDGLTAIVVDRVQARDWSQALSDRHRITYAGQVGMAGAWIGGSYFAGESPLLTGLPQHAALNWQYQLLCNRPGSSFTFDLLKEEPKDDLSVCWGLRIGGANIIHVIGAQSATDLAFSTALCVIPYGKGKVIINSLDMLHYLNSSLDAAETVRKLFCNLIQYGTQP